MANVGKKSNFGGRLVLAATNSSDPWRTIFWGVPLGCPSISLKSPLSSGNSCRMRQDKATLALPRPSMRQRDDSCTLVMGKSWHDFFKHSRSVSNRIRDIFLRTYRTPRSVSNRIREIFPRTYRSPRSLSNRIREIFLRTYRSPVTIACLTESLLDFPRPSIKSRVIS